MAGHSYSSNKRNKSWCFIYYFLSLTTEPMTTANDYFEKYASWKIKKGPYIQYKTKGKTTASMKSEMGEGVLYQQLLPTLKTDIPGFQKTCPCNINRTDFLKTTIRSQSCIPIAWHCQGGEGLAGTPKAPSISDRIKRRSGSQHYREDQPSFGKKECKVLSYLI